MCVYTGEVELCNVCCKIYAYVYDTCMRSFCVNAFMHTFMQVCLQRVETTMRHMRIYVSP